MDSEQINSFWLNGYIVLKDLFSPDVLHSLKKAIDSLTSDPQYLKVFPHLYDFEPQNQQILRRIQDPERIDPTFRMIATNPLLLKNLSQLIGENIRLERTKIHMKQAKYGSDVGWHQDWAYQCYTNDNILSVAIFLDDCTKQNAPIHIIPETHTGAIYPHVKNGNFSGFIEPSKYDELCTTVAQPLLGKMGDISIHHYRTVHFSPNNTSEHSRRILLLRYAAAHAWPLMGSLDFKSGFSLDELKSRIVLGEQTLTPTLKDIPVRLPLPYPKKFEK